MRTLIPALLLFLLAGSLLAKDDDPWQITFQSGVVADRFRLDSLLADTLVAGRDGIVYHFPLNDIVEIRLEKGTYSRIGGVFGIILGLGAGLASVPTEQSPGETPLSGIGNGIGDFSRVMGSAILGGIVGTTAGYFISRDDVYDLSGKDITSKVLLVQSILVNSNGK
jgi:hypothetical protein